MIISCIQAAACECGCGQDAGVYPRTDYRYGTFKGADKKFISGHQAFHSHEPRGHYKKTRYVVDEVTGCWNWALARNKKYGMAPVNSSPVGAHRFYYEEAKGLIPDGLEIDHVCRNTLCVNPDHLEAVTHAENSRRKPSTKLSIEMVSEIREKLNAGGISKAQLARDYGVARTTISAIYINQNWKDVG